MSLRATINVTFIGQKQTLIRTTIQLELIRSQRFLGILGGARIETPFKNFSKFFSVLEETLEFQHKGYEKVRSNWQEMLWRLDGLAQISSSWRPGPPQANGLKRNPAVDGNLDYHRPSFLSSCFGQKMKLKHGLF